MKKQLTKKVIAGKYKNKTILLPSLDSTRSSKSIVKESFFNTIQFDIYEKTFIEVFAGSGSIGIEALSRGADTAIFIEKDRAAYKILQQNIENIGIEDAQTYNGDSFELFPTLIESQSELIVYIDPPFMIREGFSDVYEKVVTLIQSIKKEQLFLIAIEHQSDIGFEENIGEFKKIKTKKFGKTSLTYYK